MAYKQHFIEWFSGKQIPSYWGSTGTVVMEDSVDGGLKLSNSGGTHGRLGFGVTTDTGAVFSHTGCKMISVTKIHQTSGQYWFHGMADIVYSPNGFYVAQPSSNNFFKLGSYGSGSTSAETVSTVALDTNFHKFELEINSSQTMTMKIDDTTTTTRTANPPQNEMQPFNYVQQDSSGTYSTSIRYLECYNT